MKKLLFSIITITLLTSNIFADRGELVDSTLLDTYSLASLNGLVPLLCTQIESQVPCASELCANLTVNNGVDLYKLVYETINVHGETTIASGLLALPTDPTCTIPMALYAHGTQNGGALSASAAGGIDVNDLGEWLISLPLSASGYIGIMPDYIGYGESACTDIHAYNHFSEAKDCVDMIRATKAFCEAKGYPYSNELFLTGYSEGGYVAMATTKEIQEFHCEELPVIASAPLSGAHNVYPLSRDSILAPSYNNMTNLTYYIYSANNVCPNILGEEGLGVAVLPEYVESINLSWDECGDAGEEVLPDVSPAASILKQDYVASILENDCHPFNEFLRRANLNNWVPNVPMRLGYVVTDEQVPYTNSITTAEWMSANGGDVTAFTIPACGEDSITHSEFAIPSLLETLTWFNSLKSTDCDYFHEGDVTLCGESPEPIEVCPTWGWDADVFGNYEFTTSCEVMLVHDVTETMVTNTITTYDPLGQFCSVETLTSTVTDTSFNELPEGFIFVEDYIVLDTMSFVEVADSVTDANCMSGINTQIVKGLELELQNNPVNTQLKLNIDNQTEIQEASLVIYNITGQKMIADQLDLNATTQYQKEVSNLATGMYLLQIQLPNGMAETIRFMKN